MTTYPQLDAANIAGPSVVFHTNHGDVTVRLFPEQAPKTVENFVTHAKNGYYDNTIFHRIIRDFMIQGGDPKGNGTGGQSIWGKPFEDEFTDTLFNFRGALSMANAGPHTNSSQFFIVQAAQFPKQMASALSGLPQAVAEHYQTAGGTPWLDGKHTVFGHVIAGLDIVDVIAAVNVNYADQPETPVVLTGLTVQD